MMRRPPRSTLDGSSAASDVYKRQDHQHVQDVLVGEAFGKELGLGHYKILATVPGLANIGAADQHLCQL